MFCSNLLFIYFLCLRNRLNKWCETENVLNQAQFGFRDKKSTTDCIFILHCLIQKKLYKKSKLFCAFIDYEKAFDTVIRDALWIKLIENKVSCKMLKIIQSLYSNVSACIKATDHRLRGTDHDYLWMNMHTRLTKMNLFFKKSI